MNLWIDKHNKPQHQWVRKWTKVTNTNLAVKTIQNNIETDPVTLISVEAEQANDFLETLNQIGGTYEIVIHGEAPARATQIITQNHWDRKVMDKRTSEIIMVLKGNHNLNENIPEDIPTLGSYLDDLALYLSDDCNCSYSYYITHPECFADIIYNVVTDYIKACYHPEFFIQEYFRIKKQNNEIDDIQCWCTALAFAEIKENNKYINGWNQYNTQHYQRKRPFKK